MINIKQLLVNKNIAVNTSKKVNLIYEQALEFSQYVEISNPIIILKLFKLYGQNKVLSQRSWYKDLPDHKKTVATLIWKLKNL